MIRVRIRMKANNWCTDVDRVVAMMRAKRPTSSSKILHGQA